VKGTFRQQMGVSGNDSVNENHVPSNKRAESRARHKSIKTRTNHNGARQVRHSNLQQSGDWRHHWRKVHNL